MLKVILAGLGVRGRHWAQVIQRSSRAQLSALVDPSAEALARALAEFGERPAFSSVAAALDALDDVDALLLANPPMRRENIIRLACARKLPLLIEKPLALDLEEASRLVAIAEAAGVSLMVGLNFRYLAVTQAMRRLLAERTVGAAEFARFTYERWRDGRRVDLNDYPLVMDQPMLWEQSIHHFDLMRYVYGRGPLYARCQTWTPSWTMYAGVRIVTPLFEFEGALRVIYQGAWQGHWAPPASTWPGRSGSLPPRSRSWMPGSKTGRGSLSAPRPRVPRSPSRSAGSGAGRSRPRTWCAWARCPKTSSKPPGARLRPARTFWSPAARARARPRC